MKSAAARRQTMLHFVLLCCGLFSCEVLAADVPALTGRVVDGAGVLSAPARARIEAALRAHEERTTDQVAVLTVPALGGESIEGYAERVFKAWKLGRADRDNGVLLVVATGDRRLRIEVGYGLEGALTDGKAGEIIRAALTPRFKQGDYDGGIEAGIAAIIGALGKGAASSPAAPEVGTAKSSVKSTREMPWYKYLVFGILVYGVLGVFTLLGIATPRSGWFLYPFLVPFWAILPTAVFDTNVGEVSILGYLVSFPIAKFILGRTAWYRKRADELKSKGKTSIGGITISSRGTGMSSDSSSGGGSDYSGGGGGDFSGGGGDSGGGGASGSW